jgi:hypothetical protein
VNRQDARGAKNVCVLHRGFTIRIQACRILDVLAVKKMLLPYFHTGFTQPSLVYNFHQPSLSDRRFPETAHE